MLGFGGSHELTESQFSFLEDWDWLDAKNIGCGEESPEAMRVFYNYSEPFSKECRAYGRLHESGFEELAVKCFGYVLLDEASERAVTEKFSEMAVMQKFRHRNLTFEGGPEDDGDDDLRSRFLGKNGRPPPIRGLVKEFVQGPELLYTRDMRKVLADIIRIQQLGIIGLDIAARNFIGTKLVDFSQAVTTPHYQVTPELNPYLTASNISTLEYSTFICSINAYWEFDFMVKEVNEEHRAKKKKISLVALPFNKARSSTGYGLRPKLSSSLPPSRACVHTHVDPRLYDWKASTAAKTAKSTPTAARALGSPPASRQSKKSSSSSLSRQRSAISKHPRRRLSSKPPMWAYECSVEVAVEMDSGWARNQGFFWVYEWEFRDGLLFPVSRG